MSLLSWDWGYEVAKTIVVLKVDADDTINHNRCEASHLHALPIDGHALSQ